MQPKEHLYRTPSSLYFAHIQAWENTQLARRDGGDELMAAVIGAKRAPNVMASNATSSIPTVALGNDNFLCQNTRSPKTKVS